MPKESFKIERFSAGLNEMFDPRDIEEGQYSIFQNFNGRFGGILKLIGDLNRPYSTIFSESDWNNENLAPWGTFYHLAGETGFKNFGLTDEEVISGASNTKFWSGFGAFTFTHDYNINGNGTNFEWGDVSTPSKVDTEFFALGVGDKVRIYDPQTPNPSSDTAWYNEEVGAFGDWGEVITSRSGTEPTKVMHNFQWDSGILRVWDGNPFNWNKNQPFYIAHVKRALWTRISSTIAQSTSDGYSGIMPTINRRTNSWLRGNLPLPIPSKADFSPLWCYQEGPTYDDVTMSSYVVDHWSNTRGTFRPDAGEQVSLEFEEHSGAQVNIKDTFDQAFMNLNDGETAIELSSGTTASMFVGQIVTIKTGGGSAVIPSGSYITSVTDADTFVISNAVTTADVDGATLTFSNGFSIPSTSAVIVATTTQHGFTSGEFVIINGCSIAAMNGKYEIIDASSPEYGLPTFTIESDVDANDTSLGISVSEGVCFQDTSSIDDSIKTKWIFGISWLYDRGLSQEPMETPIATGKLPVDEDPGMSANLGTPMDASNVIDFTSYVMAPRCKISFMHHNEYENNNGLNSLSEMQAAGQTLSDARRGWHRRMTGFRIYAKDVIDNTLSNEWQLFSEVDFTTGEYRIEMGSGEVQLLTRQSGHKIRTSGTDSISGLASLTFEVLNGYSTDMTTDVLYKSSVISNQRVRYVGNIMIPDGNGDFFKSDGEDAGVRYPDRMMTSVVGGYDVFPNDGMHFIDVAINDGDAITHLEILNDKILQFKKNKCYIINVSNPDHEFPEGVYDNAGIIKPCQITKTEQGFCWANSSGVFKYDGQNVSNISLGLIDWEGQSSTLLSYIRSGITPPVVGYDKITQRVIILLSDDSTYKYDGGWAHDIMNNSFTKLVNIAKTEDATSGSLNGENLGYGAISNFVNFNSGHLGLAVRKRLDTNYLVTGSASFNSAVPIITYLEPPSGHADAITVSDAGLKNVSLKTKDFDFGDPSIRKKIYRVYITYKSPASNSNMQVQYYVNGETSSAKNFAAVDNVTLEGGTSIAELDGSKSQWTRAALKPATSSEANNIYSFQLSLFSDDGTYADKDFEINDITIVLRKKPVK